MAKGPRLDLRRLEREAASADMRSSKLAPGGKPITGVMALVRENLDALVALKVSGRSWGAIAAGLTAQGFRTADGRDLTAANLTGVISSVRRQAARKLARETERRSRGDSVLKAPEAVNEPTPSSAVTSSPRLSPDLAVTPAAIPHPQPAEDERRRAALARARSLLKKD